MHLQCGQVVCGDVWRVANDARQLLAQVLQWLKPATHRHLQTSVHRHACAFHENVVGM
jgi:hypothetical protein